MVSYIVQLISAHLMFQEVYQSTSNPMSPNQLQSGIALLNLKNMNFNLRQIEDNKNYVMLKLILALKPLKEK